MKTHQLLCLLTLVAGPYAHAQRPDARGERRTPPPIPPLFAALDMDHDGILSTREIRGADRSLEKLDKNRDRQITMDELRMPPPPPPVDGEEPPRPPEGRRPPPPVIAALDADHDGTISAEELANATEALKTLDEDADGELSPPELRPHGPPPEGPPPAEEGENPPPPAAE